MGRQYFSVNIGLLHTDKLANRGNFKMIKEKSDGRVTEWFTT